MILNKVSYFSFVNRHFIKIEGISTDFSDNKGICRNGTVIMSLGI